jgi:hypothetical protein
MFMVALVERKFFFLPNMKRGVNQNLIFVLLFLCAFIVSAPAQPNSSKTPDAAYLKKAEEFQNRQRAFNLSILKSDIKLVDDTAMRCFLRVQIMRFIFEKKVTDYFETANSLGMECLDDIVDPENKVSESQSSSWKREVVALLRINSPTAAIKAEKKYPPAESDWDEANYDELNMGGDPAAIANRVVAKIATGTLEPSISFLIDKLKEKDPPSAWRVLDAIVGYYETHPVIKEWDSTLTFLNSDFLDETTPIFIKKRYFYLVLKLSENALTAPDDKNLFRMAVDLLKWALPKIREILPEAYPQALALYSALNSRRSDHERETAEVYRRIEESKDKLAQTISEAESAQSKDLKSSLFQDAAKLAVKEKKFRLATDLMIKIEYPSSAYAPYRQYFLINDVLNGALKEKDLDSAEYVIEKIEQPLDRGRAILMIVTKLVELKDNPRALDKLYDALKPTENADNSPGKVRIMLSAVPVALKLDRSKAFDVASSAIKVINRLPTPNPEDKPGTDKRNMYIDQVLLANAYNLRSAFTLLGKTDMSLAYPVSQSLQLRDLRLVTQIALETERIYPYEPEPDKKPGQKDKQ